MKRCKKPFWSDTYIPKFGDIIHCDETGNHGGDDYDCTSIWMSLGSPNEGATVSVVLLEDYTTPGGYKGSVGDVSVCNIMGEGKPSWRSAWHLAEEYAPKE